MISLHRFLAARLFYPTAAASALAVLLLIGRGLLGAGPIYRFLVWNLFLAWLPYLAALGAAAIDHAGGEGRGRWGTRHGTRYGTQHAVSLLRSLGVVSGVVGLGGLWLLFLPNAPYLMTDLVHLPGMRFVPWYDIGMLLAFAWAGCLLGVASLHIMQGLVRQRFGAIAG